MPKSVKTSAKKAPAKSKKLATPATKSVKKPADSEQGLMWQLLKHKQEQQKLNNQKQSESHVKMHEQRSHGPMGSSTGHSRFAGPRRRAV